MLFTEFPDKSNVWKMPFGIQVRIASIFVVAFEDFFRILLCRIVVLGEQAHNRNHYKGDCHCCYAHFRRLGSGCAETGSQRDYVCSCSSNCPSLSRTLHHVNIISDGSPSRMRMVRLISLGMTTLPRSSIRLTMPVAFIYK